MRTMKIVIVGGVAGGASCAARARRLSEESTIIMLERGPHVSFANCGLPYHVGGEIKDKSKLLVQTPEKLNRNHNLDVRVMSEVIKLNAETKEVEIRRTDTGETYRESYDELVLAVGAAPLKPPIPGINLHGHFTLRNIPDMETIIAWIDKVHAKTAVVVGGGYIGLEMAEQLQHRGLKVSIAEALPQVMAPIDPEMAAMLHAELAKHDIDLYLNDGVSSFEAPTTGSQVKAGEVVLKSGTRLPADVVILGLGVRPDIAFVKEAGVTIGERGGIRVDEHMRTNLPNVWAVGDAVEVRDTNTGEWSIIPLAGPANRQGRIVADNIFGTPATYKGTQGTAILRLFGLAAGCTGANEKTLKRTGKKYQAIHLHPGSHAGYFPGAHPIAMKVLFDPDTGKLLGAQAVGADGVDKRIDVFATALAAGMTMDDLAELELAYAPPFGSAKDPVNLSGMIAQNVMSGLVSFAQWSDIPNIDTAKQLILDLRENAERAAGHIRGSIHIPLGELRQRLNELPKDKEIIAHCASGQRSYYATRILMQNGFQVRNLSGSYKTWSATQPPSS